MKYLGVWLFVINIAAAQPETARDLNERGLAAYTRGDFAAAERLYLEAIPQWQALGDAFTAHLAITRMNLGDALAAEGRRGEALAQMQQSLALYRRSLGVRNGHTLDCMNAVGGLELTLNDYEHAGVVIEEALRIERELFPADPRLATTLAELATLRLRTGRMEEAPAPAEEALALAIKTAGADSLNAALAYTVVGEVHRIADRPSRALPLYRRARAIYEKRLGPEHPRVASLLAQEGLLLAGEGKLATAARSIERALAMLEHTCPGCAYERSTADTNLAQVRVRQGQYAEAERLLEEALALSEQAQPQSAEADALRQALADVHAKQQHVEMADRRH